MIYSKQYQVRKNKVDKPTKYINNRKGKKTQRQRGAISPAVRAEVKKRSNGLCEIRKRCTGDVAVHMCHLQSRNSIEATTADMLLHGCVKCHDWLDKTGDGVIYKKSLRRKDAG